MGYQGNKPTFEDKWSTSIGEFGFVSLPLAIFYFKQELEITSAEIEVLAYLLAHRWDADKDPYPSLKKIALKAGKSEGAVRTNVRSLEKKGCIKRNFRTGRTNEYSIDPLIALLETLIENSERASYFQAEGFQDSDTPPYQKTDTKVDEDHLDEAKKMLFADHPYDKNTKVIVTKNGKPVPNQEALEHMKRMNKDHS